MKTEPQKEHQWLQQLLGEWSYDAEGISEPGQAPEVNSGIESVRSLGGLWFVAEGQGSMPGGGEATMIMTLGYDPKRGRFVGTWIGSMMTHLWVYEGTLDASGKVLTLEAEGPSFATDGTMARYRDVIEIKSADHRLLTSYALGDDGEWRRFMTANYRRTK